MNRPRQKGVTPPGLFPIQWRANVPPILPASSDYREILEILRKTDFDSNLSMKRQITSHMRDLILTKQLAPGTRLPPLQKMADSWYTNYFTTQTALLPLVTEGLLVQTPKRGTFVASHEPEIRRVCLYHEYDLTSDWHSDFYTLLNVWCYRLLSERGIISIPYFDHRPKAQRAEVPPEIREMIRGREIDAVIATCIAPSSTSWLTKLGVPFTSSMFLKGVNQVVRPNYDGFANLAVTEAKKLGAKTLGFINILNSGREETYTELERAAAKAGISIIYPANVPGPIHWEKTGFQLCENLLKLRKRPEAIFVHPDTLIRGVSTALLKNQVRVPEDLHVICHRNAETQIYLPFPVTWLTVKIEDYARALIKRIDRQITGKKLNQVTLPIHVERTNPH